MTRMEYLGADSLNPVLLSAMHPPLTFKHGGRGVAHKALLVEQIPSRSRAPPHAADALPATAPNPSSLSALARRHTPPAAARHTLTASYSPPPKRSSHRAGLGQVAKINHSFGSDMSGGKKRKSNFEEEALIFSGHEADESETLGQRNKMTMTPPYLQMLIDELMQIGDLGVDPKNQLLHSSPPASSSHQQRLVEMNSNAPPSSSTEQSPTTPFPPCSSDDALNRFMGRKKVYFGPEEEKDPVTAHPAVRRPKDRNTSNAVHDLKSKEMVLAAARSVVSITPILDDKPTGQYYSGFVLRQYEHSGFAFSIIVTCSSVVCRSGQKLDPLPKLSVGLPDKNSRVEAKFLYFNYHYDIAFLLLPMELSLDVPCLGSCPDYNQEVLLLARDNEASLRVRRRVISWTEESDHIGRDHYMFLNGYVPPGGTGGPVTMMGCL